MEVKTIAVIGAGTMGRGIAYAAAFGGYRTILEDITQSMLDAGLDYIRTSLDEAVTRGKLTAEQRDRAVRATWLRAFRGRSLPRSGYRDRSRAGRNGNQAGNFHAAR